MIKLFYKLLDVSANNIFASILKSLGVGLASGAAIYVLVSTYIQNVVATASTMPYLGLLALFSIDKGLSIILGAILTRASYQAMTVGFVKKG